MNFPDHSLNFGNIGTKREFIPLEARAILVEKILTLGGSRETREALERIGIRRKDRAVMLWMERTRRWLGIEACYPNTNSPRYRVAVREWIEKNGRPTREEILAGWNPGDARRQP